MNCVRQKIFAWAFAYPCSELAISSYSALRLPATISRRLQCPWSINKTLANQPFPVINERTAMSLSAKSLDYGVAVRHI